LLYAALFICACIAINYSFNVEHGFLDKHFGRPIGIVLFVCFFAFAYYGMAVPLFLITGKRAALCNPMFWIKSGLFILILGVSISFYHHYLLDISTSRDERYFLRKVLANAKNTLVMVLPLVAMKLWFDRRTGDGLYGLNTQPFDWRPYVTLVAALLPLIALISFHPDFQHSYPTFKPWRVGDAYGLRGWQLTGLYEAVYGFDFISIELMFRGALVIGISRLLGTDAVLPMVSAYTFLHFGKPLGESVSSVIGGYILGVVALRTRSVWGGCIVHIGLAYAMEAAALLQHYLV
jgi:hypothetical protein